MNFPFYVDSFLRPKNLFLPHATDESFERFLRFELFGRMLMSGHRYPISNMRCFMGALRIGRTESLGFQLAMSWDACLHWFSSGLN